MRSLELKLDELITTWRDKKNAELIEELEALQAVVACQCNSDQKCPTNPLNTGRHIHSEEVIAGFDKNSREPNPNSINLT